MKSMFALLFLIFLVSTDAKWTSRIVGGEYASVNQFPHQIALYKYGQFTCGGSIIGKKWVLTAAHCVAGGV